MNPSRDKIAGNERQQTDADGDKNKTNSDARSTAPTPAQNVVAANGDESSGKARRKTKLHRNAPPSKTE
jgi:hypothetical protein